AAVRRPDHRRPAERARLREAHHGPAGLHQGHVDRRPESGAAEDLNAPRFAQALMRAPSASSVASLNFGPAIWRPTGSPRSLTPQKALTAGMWTRLNGAGKARR